MNDFLSYVVLGIPIGCVFALMAIGIVLTYKTSGVFNLAFGAQAFVSAAIYFDTVLAPRLAPGARLPRRGRHRRTAPRPGARPGALPPPPYGAVGSQTGHVTRPARCDPPSGEAVVRLIAGVQPTWAHSLGQDLLLGTVRARRQSSRHDRDDGDRGARARDPVPPHQPRAPDAGGGREPTHDGAQRGERQPRRGSVVDVVESVRRSGRRAACTAVRSGQRAQLLHPARRRTRRGRVRAAVQHPAHPARWIAPRCAATVVRRLSPHGKCVGPRSSTVAAVRRPVPLAPVLARPAQATRAERPAFRSRSAATGAGGHHPDAQPHDHDARPRGAVRRRRVVAHDHHA